MRTIWVVSNGACIIMKLDQDTVYFGHDMDLDVQTFSYSTS